ncbi:M17 family peptidase N-terminal domain-containing protein [Polymorphobacter fuscus]|uniref:Peptidase M17 n=1 Tax=Sandarakinorhabdus fusca TaxID=1439888 RepID=A0A7C9GVI0_9SPHN|nr:M17 family peptidase N-terminal domain-containing protein [Polymorphobacter fuscus]KAB7648550.1 peptidase M17 [Polymorphobacter fuscus]MQT16094.1 peptidase M17 [Polymorphobacter fuscus]NJC07627.1 hypothetical protein [Polymorphobacter fuscus]
MTDVAPQTLGQWRDVVFKVAQIDVATICVDLLIVGMSEQDVAAETRGGASQLDVALHGTLGRLREGGIFGGRFRETLVLTPLPAPVRAGTLLLVGMGPASRVDADSLFQLTHLAMRDARRRRAARAACLLGWSELDIPTTAIATSAASMMHGALRAIDDHPDPGVPPLEWIFDIRNGEAARTTRALTAALAAWR